MFRQHLAADFQLGGCYHMSKESTSAEIQKALKTTVETYTPLRIRFKRLLDFREEIQQLRNRRASFAAIADILRKDGVETSVELVRLYYQELTGRRGRKGKRHGRPPVSTTTSRKAIPFKHPALRTLANHSPESGPRIANVEDL
jgi:hypothetical protein